MNKKPHNIETFFIVQHMADDELKKEISSILKKEKFLRKEMVLDNFDALSIEGAALLLQHFDVTKEHEDYDMLGPHYRCHYNKYPECFLAYDSETETHEKAICRAVVFYKLTEGK